VGPRVVPTAAPVSYRRAWIVALVVLAAGVTAAANQYKVPALLPLLMKDFDLNLSAAGWLVSVFSITGVILALPSGLIVHRLGPRSTGIAALALITAGSVVGSLGFGLPVLVLTRIAEGAGLGLLSVSGPALIAEWFPPERRGAPMGIYAVWVPVGAMFAFDVAPGAVGSAGWELAWVGGAAISLAGLLAYYFLARSPVDALDDGLPVEAPRIRELFASRDIWLLSGAFLCSALAMGVVPNFFSTFLVSQRGWTLDAAGGMTGLRMAALLISCPLAGLVADRIGSWKLVYTIPAAGLALIWPFLFRAEGPALYGLLFATGLLGGAFPTAAFGAVPEIMRDKRLVGVGLSIMTLGLAVANVLSPIIFGHLIELIGWDASAMLLVPVTLAGIVLGWKVRIR
jgi:MFS family permease